RHGEVERDAALVAVAREVVGAQGRQTGQRQEWRPPGTRLVAGAGALDLDDLRAEVAEHLSAERSSQHARGVQHAQPGQRRPMLFGHHASSRSRSRSRSHSRCGGGLPADEIRGASNRERERERKDLPGFSFPKCPWYVGPLLVSAPAAYCVIVLEPT